MHHLISSSKKRGDTKPGLRSQMQIPSAHGGEREAWRILDSKRESWLGIVQE
jgi:hypothetical protein